MNCKVNIFASIYPTIQEACLKHNWSVGLHGSIARDFDLMLQPYGDTQSTIVDVLKAIRTELKLDGMPILYAGKTIHNRCAFGLNITTDMYLDITVIDDGTIGIDNIVGNVIM